MESTPAVSSGASRSCRRRRHHHHHGEDEEERLWESLTRVSKEEEDDEDARRNFDETSVSYGLFNSPAFEGKRKLRFVRELFDRIATTMTYERVDFVSGTSHYD